MRWRFLFFFFFGAGGVAGRVELTFLARHVDFAFNCFIVRQVLAITHSHTHTHTSMRTHTETQSHLKFALCRTVWPVVDLVGGFPPRRAGHLLHGYFFSVFQFAELSNSEGEYADRRLLSDIRASAGCTNYAKCNT